MSWDHNDVSSWIMTLENGLFKEYKGVWQESLEQEKVKGIHLENVDVLDVKGWGVQYTT